MSDSGDQLFIEQHRDALNEMAAVLAGKADPTRASFMALARVLSELLRQHEGALAQIEKTKRNAGKRARKAEH